MVSEAKPTAEGISHGYHRAQGIPLIQILDEIESSIKLVNQAAKDARQAAEEVRQAQEKAANEVISIASATITIVDEVTRQVLGLVELVRLAREFAEQSGSVRFN